MTGRPSFALWQLTHGITPWVAQPQHAGHRAEVEADLLEYMTRFVADLAEALAPVYEALTDTVTRVGEAMADFGAALADALTNFVFPLEAP